MILIWTKLNFVSFGSPCLSLSFRLILWSAEARWAHFLAQVSKSPSRRHKFLRPPQEGTLHLHPLERAPGTYMKQFKLCSKSFIGSPHKPGNISLSLSLLLSYHRLWTTRSGPLKHHNSNLLLYSCLKNSMVRGAWLVAVHRVTNSWTWPKQLHTHIHIPFMDWKIQYSLKSQLFPIWSIYPT